MVSSYSDLFCAKPRRVFLGCLALVGVSIISLFASTLWTLRPSTYVLADSGVGITEQPPTTVTTTVFSTVPTTVPTTPAQEVDRFDSKLYLRGPPTNRFRDNLRPEVEYITSWLSAGWTNDVITYINLIYLGLLTNRVPIIGQFTPSHIGGHVPPIDFGDVFDVPRLREIMQKPLIEWHEVKDRKSDVVEELGCWNLWEAVQDREHFPRRSAVAELLHFDISYTKLPTWIKLIPRFEHDQHASFSSLASFGFPEFRTEYGVDPSASPLNHVKLPPDEHMLCYDYLYYVCAHQPYEFDHDYSPAWLMVGQYMHWNPWLKNLADSYVRRTLGTPDDEATPPWIGIHIRHGDFANWCGGVPVPDCFSPISVIRRRVEEVKQELLERKGMVVNHVIMTSDERNETWWEAVTAEGWYGIDHSKTVELYGAWYPVLIDAVIQSGGAGFVGTDRSTMSVLARRRVLSWRDGAVRYLKWGRPGADDH